MGGSEVEVQVMGALEHQEGKMPAQHFVILRDDKNDGCRCGWDSSTYGPLPSPWKADGPRRR